MKIKRFFAKDMREALEQVKEHLGPDAVIMSNKKVAGGVEIVAAFDDAASAAPVSRQDDNEAIKRELVSQLTAARKRLMEESKGLKSGTQSGLGYASASGRTSATDNAPSSLPSFYARGREPEEAPVDSLSALLDRQQRFRQEGQGQASGMQKSTANTAAGHGNQAAHSRSDASRQPSAESPVNGGARYANLDPLSNTESRPRSRSQENQRALEQMRSEMQSIRRLLEHQVSNLMWQEMERKEPVRAMLIERLLKMGFPEHLAEQLVGYIPEKTELTQAWSLVLELLTDQLMISDDNLLSRGGVVALVGPTGVGKTTTIAKLAARYAMEYGAEHIALVTTDSYRIGAHEQLATYGRILGCPVRAAKDADELAAVLYQLRHKHFVLLDTAGMGQRDLRLTEQLNTLMQTQGERIRSLLVLPATAQRSVLQETVEHFRRIPLSGTILTKLDESLSLGEVMSVTIQNALPISYITDGQRVPEDIRIASRENLVKRAAELLDKDISVQHFWTSERAQPQAADLYE
ncbi:MAG: flagellar biosynthesis protein FlhF [Plesiomonas sp.]